MPSNKAGCSRKAVVQVLLAGKIVTKDSDSAYYFCFIRRSWKKRYFVLRGKTLTYYAEDDLESAKPQGVIELNDVT